MPFTPATPSPTGPFTTGAGTPAADAGKIDAEVDELRNAGLLVGSDLNGVTRAGSGGPARLHYAADLTAAQALVSAGTAQQGDWIGTP